MGSMWSTLTDTFSILVSVNVTGSCRSDEEVCWNNLGLKLLSYWSRFETSYYIKFEVVLVIWLVLHGSYWDHATKYPMTKEHLDFSDEYNSLLGFGKWVHIYNSQLQKHLEPFRTVAQNSNLGRLTELFGARVHFLWAIQYPWWSPYFMRPIWRIRRLFQKRVRKNEVLSWMKLWSFLAWMWPQR